MDDNPMLNTLNFHEYVQDIPRFDHVPEGETKYVIGDGDCSAHAVICAIIAWLLSLPPGARKQSVYQLLMQHCYDPQARMMVPSNFRHYIGTLGNHRDPGAANVADLKAHLTEEGSSFFFTTISRMLHVQINVWIQNEYHPFGLSRGFSDHLHIRNVPAHFEAIVPFSQLAAINDNLGDRYHGWYVSFFTKLDRYYKFNGNFRWSEEIGEFVQNVELDTHAFQLDLTNSLVAAFTGTARQRPPEWHRYWIAHLEARLSCTKLDPTDRRRIRQFVAEYEAADAKAKDHMDKSFFETVSEKAAERLARLTRPW